MKRISLRLSGIVVFGMLIFAMVWAARPALAEVLGNPREEEAQEGDKPRLGDWARATLDSMSLDEKIGQLFMIAAYSNKNEAHATALEKLIKDYHIGGLIFMQGGPGRQVNLINRFQKKSTYPLLIAQDSEWGLAMRLDSCIRYPKNMTLGAIRDSMLLFEMGMELGRQCRRVGVQVNFAPVVDVNNNPANPVINDRSFGENRENVATKGIWMYKGMEYAGAVGCAKHFPGHGDTDTDSHMDLPLIEHSRARLDSIELYPFKKMVDAGIASMMVAHLYIPALDTTPNLASTLSPKVVTDLLRNDMGFRGLTFTDALGMKGVTKFFENGETDLRAFLAGNDVLLFSKDVPVAHQKIKEAVENGEVSMQELDYRVLKILVTKEWCGLHKDRFSKGLKSLEELNTASAEDLRKKLYEAAITLLKNEDVLPIKDLRKTKIACVEIGGGPTVFVKTLQKYAEVDPFSLSSSSDAKSQKALLTKLKGYDLVIVGVDDMSKRISKNFGITAGTRSFMKDLNAQKSKTAVVLFGSPYGARSFGEEDVVMLAYENKDDAKVAAAEALFGGIDVDGIMPVTASEQFPEGTSLILKGEDRLGFGIPESVGMDSEVLAKIDSVAEEAISTGATPGCAVLVARGNTIVFDKGYGQTEYKGGRNVDPQEVIYDLASVTKISATTLAAMRLQEEGLLDVDEAISVYLPEFRGKNMTHIKVKNLLMHNAGFKSWIPFYRHTLNEAQGLREDVYQDQPDSAFCVKVMDGLYMCKDYQDSIWLQIVNSNIRSDKKVRYSDLGMIVMTHILEKVTGTSLDRYVDSVFYQPMGLNNTFFNPAENAPEKYCAPTENDTYWRKKKVQGYVHDQASAMLGGVSGHAGLFSNVYDLAKLMYMVKNEGRYAGVQYLNPETIQRFTAKQLSNSRKGLGWDKASTDPDHFTPCSQYASGETYGHLGFTGIGVWVDPKYDLIFVFLSNRTWPDANNKKLIRSNVRPAMHDLAYEAIFAYQGTDLP